MGGQLRPNLLSRVAGQSTPKVIIAYHGSPHSFDRFDASKIGTGEGAQAYGHGLYFAGAEDTADFYRRELSGGDDQPPQSWVRDFWEAQAAPDAVGSPESAHEWLVGFLRSNADPGSGFTRMNRRYYRQALDYLLEQDPRAVPPPLPLRPGHIYEVEIGFPEEALLDLDSPLAGEHKAAVLGAAFAAPANKWQSMAIAEAAGGDTPAKVPLESLMRAYNALQPDPYAGRVPSQAAVSRSLLERGIPGNRYLDASSRSSGQGTRNYVMFPGTEDRIRILRKYGLLAPMALPAASEE
jgi:hypothetical protein